MHSFVLALVPLETENIRETIKRLISRYDENLYTEVTQKRLPPYLLRHYLRSHHLGTDICALAAKLKGKLYDDAGVDTNGLWVKTDRNVESRFDYWLLGGRYDGLLYGEEFHKQCMDSEEEVSAEEYLNRNVRPVIDLPQEHFTPVDIITPEGAWHSIQDLGWIPLVAWGHAEDTGETRAAAEKWPGIVQELLYKHLNCLAVGLDVHS